MALYQKNEVLFIARNSSNEKFDISPDETIFRLGKKSDSRLDHVRPRDMSIYDIGGQQIVKAEKEGISLLTLKGLLSYSLKGWIWIIFPNTPIPKKLLLMKDNDNHLTLSPKQDMRLEEFIYLLKLFKDRCLPWHIQSEHEPEITFNNMIQSDLSIFKEKDPYFLKCLVEELKLIFAKNPDADIPRNWNEKLKQILKEYIKTENDF